MNKCTIPTALLCALVFSNCAKIKEYRKPPSEWGKSDKRTSRKAIRGFHQETTNRNVQTPSQLQPQIRPQAVVPAQPQINKVITPTVIKPVNTPSQPSLSTGRVVPGFMEPASVTDLPDNKDLQESNNIIPVKPTIIRRVEEPVLPLLQDPNDGLIPPP